MTVRRHPDAAQARPPPTQVPAPERTATVHARGEGHSAAPPPPPRTAPPPSPSSPPRFDFAALQLHRDPPARAAAAPAIHAAALAGIRGSGQALPHRERIERAFGASHDLRRISAHIGGQAGEASARLGANGYAIGEHVAFRTAPDLRLAAHEAAHVVQQRTGVALTDGVGRDGDRYEQWADAVAERVVQGRTAADLLPSRRLGAPRVAVQLDRSDDQAVLDRQSDANEIRNALVMGAGQRVLEILSRNADPDSMVALRRAYGDQFGYDLRTRLPPDQFARARGIAGDQIALDVQVDSDDTASVFADLERISDAQALGLILSTALRAPIAIGAEPGATPALSTLADVQTALRKHLSAEDYYRAMRLILEKAQREVTRNPDAIGLSLGGDGKPGAPSAAMAKLLVAGPLSDLRIDLAEERLRRADGRPGSQTEVEAYLAIADLSAAERKALAARLRDRPQKASPLHDLPLNQLDDATAIRQVILAASAAAPNHRVAPGLALDVALERAGKLIRNARARASDPKASKSERDAASKEVARLQRMFYDSPDGQPVLATVIGASSDADILKDRLELLGVDEVAIGAELLAPVWVTSNVPHLIATLKKIPAEHRRAAMERAGKLADVQQLPPDQRELIQAYLDVGAPATPAPPGAPVLDIDPSRLGIVPPEVTIALADVIEGIERGPAAAHVVLARLQRLPYPLRKVLFAQPRYRAAVARMPRGAAKSEERDFADALVRAEQGDTGPDLAIEHYPGSAGPYQQVVLEHIRVRADKVGQATLRRGYVLRERTRGAPAARAALAPMDRVAIKHYEELEGLKPTYFEPRQAEVADDLAFGSIQLTDSPASALDPDIEAAFMDLRLHKAAGLHAHEPLSRWTGSPASVEALTAFQTMYAGERPGGVTRGGLAQLAEIYYRALREIEKYRNELAENESLASIAATVAGVVVAVGMTVITGGAALPLLAVSALSGTAAGVASATVGFAVRMHSTTGSVLRDFGGGFVEGVTSIASAGLAARIVRSAAAGVRAGKAAASVGARVVGQATGHAGAAAIAETALDGAFSGAAGELFQTAVDEATWDRGVGEAIAKMLAAIARGGALGAAGGALVGGLAKLAARLGRGTAENVGALLDRAAISRRAVDAMTEHAQDELARATHLIEAGQLEEAERVIRGIPGITARQRELLLAAARARAVFRLAAADGIEVQGEFRFPEFVDDARFRELAGHQDAHAIVVIRDGKPGIVARKGTPISAIREEVIHLYQWESSVAMRTRMQNLAEENLANWRKLPAQQKLALHIDQLEIEADAQRQIIRHFAGSEEDPEAALRVLDAEEALLLTNERLAQLKAARPPLDTAGLQIDRAPRIFSRTTQSAPASGPDARRALKLIGKEVDDADVKTVLEDLRYRLHHIEGDHAAPVFRLTREPGRSDLPHLSISEGKIVQGEPRQNFAEIKADAAAAWASKQSDLGQLAHKLERGKLGDAAARQAQLEIEHSGPGIRAWLQHKVDAGEIDKGTAGLVANWGRVLEKLESGYEVKIYDVLARHVKSKSITAGELSALREELREITARELVKLRGSRRAQALHEMLEIQPDNASKGHLFREYRREAMRLEGGTARPVYGVSRDASPESFHGKDLANRRTPDDVVHVLGESPGQLKPGRYAVEDKTGAGAFKLDQAEDYARRSYKPGKPGGGFTRTKASKATVYDGLIYVFSTESEARAAMSAMVDNRLVTKVLGKEPGGIHVMYIDRFGKVVRL